MGTQGTGRKRSTKKERSTAEDDALNLIAREAEARLAAKRAARAEAREIRMKELERQQKELSDDDERMSVGSRGSVRVEDRDYLEKGSRAASALTAGTLTSLGGTSSRRGSGETSITVEAETSIREIKDALAEVEEKYRKAMVSNAQLDNEKNNLMYQVDTLKDSLMELEEQLSESRREYEEKVKEFEREKHAHSVLQFQFNEMKEMLKQSEELLNEIRQLRIKQEGLVREISDLQETVEWKDKKIGALERQKEYTDAIRIERDELREEVVKLKDILKKHGIVLGPDLNVNGDIGETEVDGSPSADPTTQPAPDSQASPTEGNSMLGNTEETQLRSSGEEEVDPEQHQEMFEEAKENHLNSDAICNVASVSTLETQPTEEQQTCVATEEVNVEESGLSKDLNDDINDCSITEAKDTIVCSPELQGIVTSSGENVTETETPEGVDLKETSNLDLGETETKSSCVDIHNDDIRESSNNIFEEKENKQEDVEESSFKNTESCPQQKAAQDVTKESLPDESVPSVLNTEPQQDPENAEEAENDEAEEVSSKSHPQGATASGKKKRKKRRGKKKGGTHEDKNQQKGETGKEKSTTEKDIESATKNNEPTTEPVIDGSVTETLKESSGDQVKNEQDRHETEEVDGAEAVKPTETVSINETLKESRMDLVTDEQDKKETLETDNVEEVEAVTTTETSSHTETPEEIRVDHVTDENNKDQSVATETVEAVAPNETSAQVETPKVSTMDPKKDEQEEEQSLETEAVEAVEAVEAATLTETFTHDETVEEFRTKEQCLETETLEEVGTMTSPVPEASLSTPDLIDISESAENTSGLEVKCDVCTSGIDNSESGVDISTNGNAIHTETEIVDSVEDEVGSFDQMKSECTPNDPETTFETVNGEENTEAESHVPSSEDIATNESESTNSSESKDNTLVSLPPTDGFTDGLKSLSGSEAPSEPSAAVNLGIEVEVEVEVEVSEGDPEEATETVKDDEEPGASTEQESFSPSVTSPSHDGDNSEQKPDQTEKEELNGNLSEPAGLVEPDSPSHEDKSDSCDSASLTENTDAVDTAESLLETVAQAAQLEDVESQMLQCEDQIDESNVSETEEINTTDLLNTPDSPNEATGSTIEQDSPKESTIAEDPDHENDQNDEQSETHLELQEPNKEQSEDNDSSQPTLQDSDEEDGEDEEGQSFDFDDMDVELAIATNLPQSPKQEGVEEGVEVMPDESNHGSSGLCQSNTESKENTQDEPVENNDEKCTVDGGSQVDTLETETDTVPQAEATSENVENVCEKQKNAPEEEVVVADEPVTEEGKVLIAGELGDVAENINQAVPLPVEEGLDAMKHELQGEDVVLDKSADAVASNKEPPQTRKDVKKNGKKGKPKGKEECKMS